MQTTSYSESWKTLSLYPEYLLNLKLPIESVHIMNEKLLSRCAENTVEVTILRKVAVNVNIAPPHGHLTVPYCYLNCFMYGTIPTSRTMHHLSVAGAQRLLI
jgi:hypothetical protein